MGRFYEVHILFVFLFLFYLNRVQKNVSRLVEKENGLGV